MSEDLKNIAGTASETFQETAPGTYDGVIGEPKRKNRNVFEEILATGHDEEFVPAITPEFCPTDAPAGSSAKVEVLAERVRKGLPLWHPEDRCSYNGLIGLHNHFRD